MEAGKVSGGIGGDEDEVEVRAIDQFGAAEFAEGDDGEGGVLEAGAAGDEFEGVLDAGFSEGGEFEAGLDKMDGAEDVAEAEAHEFGLEVTAEPEVLIGVGSAMAEVLEGLGGVFLADQVAADLEFIDQVGFTNGEFGEEFGAIEQFEDMGKDIGSGGPEFVEEGTGAVGGDVGIEAGEDAIGIGEDEIGVRLRGGVGGVGGWEGGRGGGMGAEFEEALEPLATEVTGAAGDQADAGAFDEGADQADGLIGVTETVSGEELTPGLGIGEVGGKAGADGLGGVAEEPLVGLADALGMGTKLALKVSPMGKVHETGQAEEGGVVVREGMGLAELLHLQAMLEIAKEAVGLGQMGGLGLRQQFVVGEFGEGDQGMGGLEEGQASAVENLEGLGEEFDFTDAATAEFDITVEGIGAHDLAFDAGLHFGHFGEEGIADGPGIAEGMDGLEEFTGEGGIAGDAPGLEEHHAFPGLAPLGVERFVAGQGAGERALLAFGAEAHIDAEAAAFGAAGGSLLDQGFAEALEEGVIGEGMTGGGGAAAGGGAKGPPFLGIDEQEIDIGTIIQFLTAEFAEAEDAEGGAVPGAIGLLMPGFAEALHEGEADQFQDAVEEHLGGVGEFQDQVGEGGEAVEVAQTDAQQFMLAEEMEGIEGGVGIAGLSSMGEEGGQGTFQFLATGEVEERLLVQAEIQPLGVLAQQAGEVGGCRQDGEEEASGGCGPSIPWR